MISGHGNSSTNLIIVADGASSTDVQLGYAITGFEEDMIRGFCRVNGINFEHTWRTCLIKERINLKDYKANIPLLNDTYKGILTEEIRSIRPNVIVPLGELSFNFLSGLSGIRKFRGSVLQGKVDLSPNPVRVIPILGPNPYLNEGPDSHKWRFISRLDFGKVSRNINESSPVQEIGKVWVARSADQFRAFTHRHYSSAEFLVFDIETFADIPTCISFCFDGQESVTVPILDYNIPLDSRVLLLMEVAKLLASPIPKVNQNIKFDWKKLERYGIRVCNVVGDTMLATSCLYCEFPKNLGFLTSIYTDMPYHKDEGKEFDPASYSRDKLYLYCAKDSLATHKIYSAQKEELVETSTLGVYEKLIEILPIYKEMEETGILVDDERRKGLLAKYESLFDIYKLKVQRLVGRSEFNPLSSVQVQNLVYEELKFRRVRGIKTNKSGSFKADEESLEMLMWMSSCDNKDGKEILRTIIDCRKLHKVIELLVLPLHPDSRMRCEFNLAGAETGRTTAGETSDYYLYFKDGKVKMGNLGHSFQTIGKHGFTVDGVTYGKDIRSMFVPDPGWNFVENDLSQAEARVDAVLARDFDILSYFDSAIGIHRLTGSWVFGCLPEEIKKNVLTLNSAGVGEDRYLIAKNVRHAGERNMMEERLMMMIHKPLLECAEILKKFHNNQPNIRLVFHKDIRDIVRKERKLVAPNGRRRDFFGDASKDHTINEAISTLPQMIVTDYLKNPLKQIVNECRDFCRPLAEAHDGFLSLVKDGKEIEYAKVFKKNVEQPIDFNNCSLSRDYRLIIPCEAAIGKENWERMEDLKI